MQKRTERIAVIGLGYVGLPLAMALAKVYPETLGFDIDARRIQELEDGHDRTKEVDDEVVQASTIKFSAKPEDLANYTFYIVTVPTPIDVDKRPDLSLLDSASSMIGPYLTPGAIVAYESTVYPGVTEEFCGPILAKTSELKQGVDFKLAYSPERINPADREHTLERITKVVSAEDQESLERVCEVYGSVIEAGLHKAPSIKVAESAKVIENVQRDLNIALMNELALIFDRMGIRTADVLAAAGTKWNFLPFVPGLVGGHCIGVDPYYLTAKAESLGYHPDIILAGRRINDSMGAYIAQKTIKLLIQSEKSVKNAKVGILGLTFKENVPDLRNSRVPDIIEELRSFGIDPLVHDHIVDPEEAKYEYDLELTSWEELTELDAVILAVSHKEYREGGLDKLVSLLSKRGIVIDVKSLYTSEEIAEGYTYWCL